MLTQRFFQNLTELIRVKSIQGDAIPFAVAFSGGGDSMALLSLACEWAKQNANKKVVALIVDHGLREGSAQEAEVAAMRAQAIGAHAKILNWVGEKPNTAIQEKARQARYALMGEACRHMGITQLLLGHTSDDQAETLFMRAQKQSGWRGFSGMQVRKTSPIWPELYNVEIVRPLLDASRGELRAYNGENNLDYIDDPSNEDRKYARVRARAALADMPDVKALFLNTAVQAQKCRIEEKKALKAFINAHVTFYDWGGVSVPRGAFGVGDVLVPQILKTLIHAVSGETKALPSDKLSGLCNKITASNFNGATLGGVRFVLSDAKVFMVRDTGAILGRHEKQPLTPVKITSQIPCVWDGRFLFETSQKNLTLVPIMGCVESLNPEQKQVLKTVPHFARAGLPCAIRGDKIIWSFGQETDEDLQLTSLIPTHVDAILN